MENQQLSQGLQTVNPIDLGEALAGSDADYWASAVGRARVIEAAARLFGRKAARQLWAELGMPVVGRNPGTPDRALVSQVSSFVEAACRIDPASRVAASDLYSAYRRWAEQSESVPLSMTMFGRCMTCLPVVKFKGRTVAYGLCVSTRSPHPTFPQERTP
ncbi:hypothetical protein Amn_23510 [Aminobacter sp. Y103A]|nr:hypothetical protein Amn_23510 [Aminobacter sp. SS-2016]